MNGMVQVLCDISRIVAASFRAILLLASCRYLLDHIMLIHIDQDSLGIKAGYGIGTATVLNVDRGRIRIATTAGQ